MKIKGNFYFLETEMGGRKTPFRDKYSPQFKLLKDPTMNKIGRFIVADDIEVKPGERIELDINLGKLEYFPVFRKHLKVGEQILVLEGVRFIGFGIITEVYS